MADKWSVAPLGKQGDASIPIYWSLVSNEEYYGFRVFLFWWECHVMCFYNLLYQTMCTCDAQWRASGCFLCFLDAAGQGSLSCMRSSERGGVIHVVELIMLHKTDFSCKSQRQWGTWLLQRTSGSATVDWSSCTLCHRCFQGTDL